MNNRIRQLRDSLGLSREKFGERLGVSGDVINNLERGRIEIREERIKAICKEFQIREEWLRTGELPMEVDQDIDFGSICLKIGVNDEKAKKAIMDYYRLSTEDKKLFWNFVDRFLKKSEG